MKAIVTAILLITPATAVAQECAWVSDSGSRISTIDDTDWEYSYAREGAPAVRCITLRSPEETVLSCEDGTEAEIFLGSLKSAGLDADLMSFDYEIWARSCD